MTDPLRAKEFFDGTEMPTSGWWDSLWPKPNKVASAVGISKGQSVIDLCAGDGWFTLPIAEIAQTVVAVDIDPDLLKVAEARMKARGLTNCHFVAGDAFRLQELWPRPVDFVFMANAFHGAPDKTRLSRGISERLRNGGRFAIVNWHQRPREETVVLGEPRGPRTELRMSPTQTIKVVQPSGLRLVEVIDLPPYHYGAIFRRTD